jgi:hypothetical protein
VIDNDDRAAAVAIAACVKQGGHYASKNVVAGIYGADISRRTLNAILRKR